jgi:hypothetical protein
MRRLAALALVSVAACGSSGPSAETIAAERAAVAADAAARADMAANAAASSTAPDAAGAPPTDQPAIASAQPTAAQPASGGYRIIRRADRQGRIDTECVVTLRYPDGTQRDILTQLGSCNEVDISIISVDRLREIGQLDDLGAQARRDIERSPGGQLLYVETEFAANVYPMNAAGEVYEVNLAD